MSLTKPIWKNKKSRWRFYRVLICGVFLIGAHQSCRTPVSTLSPSGAVVSAHPLATAVGMEVLRNGGNAFDAAAAVHFALSVVYPIAGNLGGGGFALYRTADGKTGSIDFRETAPARASANMYVDAFGKLHAEQTRLGILSSGVPGSVAGMEMLHRNRGRLTWSEVVQPAVGIARQGFGLTAEGANDLRTHQHDIDSLNPFVHPFQPKQTAWQEGDTLVQRELAQTLQLIADSGAQVFYRGSVARLIAADQAARGGLISREDLNRYACKEREPIHVQYKNCTVHTMAPPSSGGIALAQLLQGSEGFDWKKEGFQSAVAVHHMVELMRRVYADRAVYGGDPDFVQVPVHMLLDSAYNAQRFSSIDPWKATPSQQVKEGSVSNVESFQTTHFSVVDEWGNAVSVTTTLNNYFGSGVWVQGAGFFLNNEMDDFSIQPGVPNQFGLVGAEANAIAPGKRMLSSMSPTIVEENGKLRFVLGTPGGSTIITNVYQVLLNCLEYEMPLEKAIEAKKIHAQWLPDKVFLENALFANEELKSGLRQRGHVLDSVQRIGKFCGIEVDLPTRELLAAEDKQRSKDVTSFAVGRLRE